MKQIRQFFEKGGFQRRLRLMSLWIAAPLLLIAILLQFFLIGPIQKAYQNQHAQQVDSVVNNINSQISSLELAMSVWGRNFGDSVTTEGFSMNTDFTRLKQVAQDLFYLSNSSSFVKKVALYSFVNEPFGLESGGTFPLSQEEADKYFNDYRIDNGRQYQWKLIDDQQLVFTQNVDRLNETDPHMFFVAIIDQNELLRLFDSTKIEGSATAITFDSQAETIIGDPFIKAVLREKRVHPGATTLNYQGTRYSMNEVDFERLSQKWHFYSLVPMDSITQQVSRFTKWLVVGSLIAILMVILLGQYFAKKQYEPFARTMKKMFGDDWDETDELAYLTEKWQDINDEQTNLKRIAAQSQRSTKRSVVRRMMQGYYGYMQEEDLQQLLQKNEWGLDYAGYQLFYIQLNDAIDEKRSNPGIDFTIFAADNIVNELTNQKFKDAVVIQDEELAMMVFAMVNSPEEAQQFADDLLTQINRILNRFATIIVSPLEQDFKNLSELVINTRNSRQYQELVAKNQIVAISNGKRQLPPKYPISLENAIITAVKNHYLSELQENIVDFIRESTREDQRQYAILSSVAHLYDSISYQLSENGISSSDYLAKETVLSRMRRLLSKEKLAKFLYEEFLKPISILWQEKIADSTSELIHEISQYIQSEFQNEQMSLETVADRFSLDPIFLSKEFKRTKKINFIDYLTDTRITEAKRLLLETDKKINVIAEEIGYNPSYFNRLFKKITGTTPGQFRKSSR